MEHLELTAVQDQEVPREVKETEESQDSMYVKI